MTRLFVPNVAICNCWVHPFGRNSSFGLKRREVKELNSCQLVKTSANSFFQERSICSGRAEKVPVKQLLTPLDQPST